MLVAPASKNLSCFANLSPEKAKGIKSWFMAVSYELPLNSQDSRGIVLELVKNSANLDLSVDGEEFFSSIVTSLKQYLAEEKPPKQELIDKIHQVISALEIQ